MAEKPGESNPASLLAIALAASAGLRAWLPLLLAGGLARAGVLDLGDSFSFLASNKALVLFGVATIVELVGDKVPAVDHALDVIGTPLRPAAGALLAASVPTASSCRMVPAENPPSFMGLPSGGGAVDALVDVSRGAVDAALVDADTARLELPHRAGLVEALVVLPDVPLVWILNPSSPELHRVIDTFLRRERRSGLIRKLARSTLSSWRPYVPPHLPEVPPGALSPYDETLMWQGRRYGIDWRLLASLMYEESRFDPDADRHLTGAQARLLDADGSFSQVDSQDRATVAV